MTVSLAVWAVGVGVRWWCFDGRPHRRGLSWVRKHPDIVACLGHRHNHHLRSGSRAHHEWRRRWFGIPYAADQLGDVLPVSREIGPPGERPACGAWLRTRSIGWVAAITLGMEDLYDRPRGYPMGLGG